LNPPLLKSTLKINPLIALLPLPSDLEVLPSFQWICSSVICSL
jgi:hypothetical protein